MIQELTVKELAEQEGFENTSELLDAYGDESVVPACCSEGCQVEPDGKCVHGNPSFLLKLGII